MISGKSNFAYLTVDNCSGFVELVLSDKLENMDGCVRYEDIDYLYDYSLKMFKMSGDKREAHNKHGCDRGDCYGYSYYDDLDADKYFFPEYEIKKEGFFKNKSVKIWKSGRYWLKETEKFKIHIFGMKIIVQEKGNKNECDCRKKQGR